MARHFQEVYPIDRKSAELALQSNNFKIVCDALLRITYHDPDIIWVQNICIKFLEKKNIEIKRLAIICLGHLTRIHKTLDNNRVLPILQKLKNDKNLYGTVEDALDDIDIFLKK